MPVPAQLVGSFFSVPEITGPVGLLTVDVTAEEEHPPSVAVIFV